MTLKLHAFPQSPRAFKVLLAAHHLGIDYELCFVDLTKGGQGALGPLNPNRRMPVLEEDGYVLWESNAILQYLAAKKPAADFWPEETRARLSVMKWMFWESAHWDPACAVLVFERLVKPLLGLGATSASEVERGTAMFSRCAQVLEGELAKHRFVCGESLTLADLCLGAVLCVAEPAQLPLESYRGIQRWQADLKALPAWNRAAALQQPNAQ